MLVYEDITLCIDFSHCHVVHQITAFPSGNFLHVMCMLHATFIGLVNILILSCIAILKSALNGILSNIEKY